MIIFKIVVFNEFSEKFDQSQSIRLEKESQSLVSQEREMSSHKSIILQSMEFDDSNLIPKRKEVIKEEKQSEEEDEEIGEDEGDDDSWQEDKMQEETETKVLKFDQLKEYVLEMQKKDSKNDEKNLLKELNAYFENITKKKIPKEDGMNDCQAVMIFPDLIRSNKKIASLSMERGMLPQNEPIHSGDKRFPEIA